MGCCISVKISRIGSFQSVPEFTSNVNKSGSESKILILGTSNSGKSTLYRQMQIINTAGFSQAERKSYKKIIIDNITNCIHALIEKAEVVLSSYSSDIADCIKEFRLLASGDRWRLSNDEENRMLQLSQQMWELPVIKEMFLDYQSELECPESVAFLLNDIDDIARKDSLPNNQQILHCRLKTTGVRSLKFVYENSFVQIIDVGGQRSERRKWMHFFDDIEVLLFCVSLNEYDTALKEDPDTTSMEESLEVFKSVINSVWFKSKTVVLFLNKVDLLEKKVETANIRDHYADFNGDPHDFADVTEFLKKKYLDCDRQENRNIFSFTTCATDTENIARVSRVCFDSVLNRHLVLTGLE